VPNGFHSRSQPRRIEHAGLAEGDNMFGDLDPFAGKSAARSQSNLTVGSQSPLRTIAIAERAACTSQALCGPPWQRVGVHHGGPDRTHFGVRGYGE
jgi:hypothetical protein